MHRNHVVRKKNHIAVQFRNSNIMRNSSGMIPMRAEMWIIVVSKQSRFPLYLAYILQRKTRMHVKLLESLPAKKKVTRIRIPNQIGEAPASKT